MTRRALITLSSVLCCALAGCGMVPGGTSTPTSSAPKPSPEFDACKLLSPDQLTSLGLEQEPRAGDPDFSTDLGLIGCDRKGKTYDVGLYRNTKKSFDTYKKNNELAGGGGEWTNVEVNGRRGAHFVVSKGKTECAFVFDVGATAAVYIQIFNRSTDPGTPCVTAERVANMVEPNLPKIQGD